MLNRGGEEFSNRNPLASDQELTFDLEGPGEGFHSRKTLFLSAALYLYGNQTNPIAQNKINLVIYNLLNVLSIFTQNQRRSPLSRSPSQQTHRAGHWCIEGNLSLFG